MPNDVIIADASSIIALNESNLLFVLKEIYATITITPKVAEEIRMTLPAWMRVIEPRDKQLMQSLLQELDEGESSSIVLATEHPGSLLIIDEKEGKKSLCGITFKSPER